MRSTGLQQYILEYADKHIYFSLDKLRRYFSSEDITFKENTLKQYLYELTRNQELFDAGKGWYSSLSNRCRIDRAPVEDLGRLMLNNFPLLSFSCWSTRQVQPYTHHLQSGFITFTFIDRDLLEAVTTQLIESGYDAFENPGKREFDKFVTHSGERPLIIVRPAISQEPVDGHFATVEKILVDLYIEKDRSFLMDAQEYKRVFLNLITSCRVNMAKLLRYSGRRKVRRDIELIINL